MGEPATSREETPIHIRAGKEDLFAIFGRPTVAPNGIGLVILTGGNVPTPSRNRLTTKLARHAAGIGYHTLRIDYHGVGESTGFVDTFRLDAPFVQDMMASIEWMRSRDLSRFVVLGSCFGGRTALAGADRISGLEGIGLISVPLRDLEMGVAFAEQPISQLVAHYRKRATLRDVIRGLFRPRMRERYMFIIKMRMRTALRRARRGSMRKGNEFGWIGRGFLGPTEWLADKAIPTLFLYGTDDDFYDDLERALRGPLGPLFEAAGNRFEIDLVPGIVHGFPSLDSQQHVLDHLISWLQRRARPSLQEDVVELSKAGEH